MSGGSLAYKWDVGGGTGDGLCEGARGYVLDLAECLCERGAAGPGVDLTGLVVQACKWKQAPKTGRT